jgi:POT family proton-dependent oligopeptide transporter
MLIREFSVETNEITSSWFQILNSFFIITFAPLFTRVWDSGFLRSGPYKFALGLILLGIGFACMAVGSAEIPIGAKTASVSMVWLVGAYFFHTLGELSLSPVGLTYVSKLAPVRMLGLMFGVFFIAYFVSSWLAGMTGSYIDPIVESKGISYFFWLFAVIPWGSALLLIAGKGQITKLMNGID